MPLLHNKYQVAKGGRIEVLEAEVTKLMAQGLVPCGGVYVLAAPDARNEELEWQYYQAMWLPPPVQHPGSAGGGAGTPARVGSGWGGGGSAGTTREP